MKHLGKPFWCLQYIILGIAILLVRCSLDQCSKDDDVSNVVLQSRKRIYTEELLDNFNSINTDIKNNDDIEHQPLRL